MASCWLQVTEPGHPARVVTVEGAVEVGRDAEGLVLDDPTVSRRHLRLEASDGGLRVVDLGSANGTWINGERLVDAVDLVVGDVIRIGETVLVVHEGREVSPAARPGDADVVVESLDRPSEAVRDLTRATRAPRRR